ncbi:MAG: TonB-dependent receptor [Candidatus Acidiferrales bacterium]
MRLNRPIAFVLVTLLGTLFLHALPIAAQSNATLNGTVADPSGAAIANARIVAQLSDSTAGRIVTRSDAEGRFSLSLAPGRYRVVIERASFTRFEQEVTLAPGETRTIDSRLELEPLAANVVVTAAADATPAEAAAAPVDIITRQAIDKRQDIFLTPILASIPGMSFSQIGPIGGTTTFFLDGGNSNYTKVLVDGVPVNQPGGLVFFENFTLDSVDKIEVVHGASSALYGSDAMSGVIQIFTHRGTTRTPQLELEGDGGTFGTGHGSGQLSGLAGAFDYSASAAYFSSNGQGPGNFFRDTTLSGNFGWRFSDNDTLRLTLRNNSSDAGQPGQTLLEPPILGQTTGLHDFSAGLSWDFSTGDHWQHRLSGFESRFDEVAVVPPFGAFDSKFNRAGLNEQSSYFFRNGGVAAGYEYEVENGGAEGRHNQAGYVEVHYQIASRLTAIAGSSAEANGAFGTRVVPRLGAAYALRNASGFFGSTRLRTSYGLGIKEPELLPAGCGPDLAPEQSRTFDAGFDQVLVSDRVHLSVTYFNNDFHDIVSFALVNANPNCPTFGGSFFNTDHARAYGANSKIETRPFRWLDVNGSYSYDDTRVLKAGPIETDPSMIPGSRLFKRPLHSANLMADAHFRRMNFNFAGYYVGRRTDSDFLGLGLTSDPSYVRWDMAASFPLRHGLSFTGTLQNIFDRQYSDAIGYPALGRIYRVGMKYVWGGD